MLSRTQQAIDKGEEVVVVGCPGGGGYACVYNIHGLAPICFVCKKQRARGIKNLRGRYTYLESHQLQAKQCSPDRFGAALKDRCAVKAAHFRGVDVGLAAYSSYTGKARDLDLEGSVARSSLSKLLCTSELLTAYFFDLVQERNISRAILYNGRQNLSRPLLRVSRLLGAEAEIMEFAGQHAGCVYEFHNCLPQDLDNLWSLIEANWDQFQGDREAAANQYFEVKQLGGAINDRSYVLGQTPGRLPHGWDSTKRNIVIFNSSEDETASLGGEYDKTLYPNQTEAIARICEALVDDPHIRICLRIHPNLSIVKWGFAMRLRHLGDIYSNVTVVAPESEISTYALLDACDVAVSFGSTMSIEAAYWDRPSIVLGRCVYERTESVYVPGSHEELIALLRQPSLQPLPKIGAMKIGLFWGGGGAAIDYFGGTRAAGFTFSGQLIKKTMMERALYAVFKSIEKWFFGTFLNYYVSHFWKTLNRYFARAHSDKKPA